MVPGIVLGLLAGKQAGVFGTTWLGCRTQLIHLPRGLSWPLLYGASLLCGIGFTMSLFIGTLAFPTGARATELKFSVLCGSMVSAAAGAVALMVASRRGQMAPEPVRSAR